MSDVRVSRPTTACGTDQAMEVQDGVSHDGRQLVGAEGFCPIDGPVCTIPSVEDEAPALRPDGEPGEEGDEEWGGDDFDPRISAGRPLAGADRVELYQRLQHAEHGSTELLDAVWEVCERIEEGQIRDDAVAGIDGILHERHTTHQEQRVREDKELEEKWRREDAISGGSEPLWPDELRLMVNPDTGEPLKLFYTMKEIKVMKLADALKAIRGVKPEEIAEELEESKAALERVKVQAKKVYDDTVAPAVAEVKMLTKLAVSRGISVRKKRSKKGAA